MSFEAAAWAIKLVPKKSGITPTEKLILIHMCDCHNGDNGKCFPSQNYLAERTGFARSTVQGALETMEEKGLFHRVPAGKGRASIYILNFLWSGPTTGQPQNSAATAIESQGPDDPTDQGRPATGQGGPTTGHVGEGGPTTGHEVDRPPVIGSPTTGHKPVINHNQEGNFKNSSSQPGRGTTDTTNLTINVSQEISGLEKMIDSCQDPESELAKSLRSQIDKLKGEPA